MDVRAVHVFDPDTGRNLTLGGSGGPATITGGSDGTAPAQAQPDTGTGTTDEDSGSAATPPR